MIDIHHHLIYGVDDGSPDLATSLAMVEEAARDGITHVVCTPHLSDEYSYPQETIQERWHELRELVQGKLELSLGCDFHMSVDNIHAALNDPLSFSVNGKGYLLIEFSNNTIGSSLFDAVYRLQCAGYKLIVTHPERYPAVHQKPELLAEWIRRDCLIQVTANALYGRCGQIPQMLANEMLQRNWIHFLATDAHRIDWRPPHLKRAYDYVANKAGQETAERLCVTNPAAVVAGKPLAEQPEPIGIWDQAPLRLPSSKLGNNWQSQRPTSPSRGFFARLFGKD